MPESVQAAIKQHLCGGSNDDATKEQMSRSVQLREFVFHGLEFPAAATSRHVVMRMPAACKLLDAKFIPSLAATAHTDNHTNIVLGKADLAGGAISSLAECSSDSNGSPAGTNDVNGVAKTMLTVDPAADSYAAGEYVVIDGVVAGTGLARAGSIYIKVQWTD